MVQLKTKSEYIYFRLMDLLTFYKCLRTLSAIFSVPGCQQQLDLNPKPWDDEVGVLPMCCCCWH